MGAGGCYEVIGFKHNVFKVKSYTVFKRRGLAHGPSFQTSVLNVGYQSRKEKERQKKISEEKNMSLGPKEITQVQSGLLIIIRVLVEEKVWRGEGRPEKSQKDQSLASHRLCHCTLLKFSGLEYVAFPIIIATLLGF